MWVKVIGALLVVLAGGGAGFYFSKLETFRIQDLSEFKKALLILASEIEYLRTPLAEACGRIASRTDKPVSCVFADFAARLEAGGGAASELWMNALAANKSQLHLKDEDMGVLEGFGNTLGCLDTQLQINAINYVKDYIEAKVTQLQTQADKNKRMYRSLGWIGGGLAAVVLW
jgi:stage III sporulation protein AB